MGVNRKVSIIVGVIGFVLLVAAIALSMLEIINAAAVIGLIVAALCIPGIYVAFESWQEEDGERLEEIQKEKTNDTRNS